MAKGSVPNDVISLGPWTGDMTQQTMQRHAAVQMLNNAGARFTTRRVDAVGWAKYFQQQAYSIPGVQGAGGGADALMYAAADPSKVGQGSGLGGSQGGTGAGSTGAGGSALAATQSGPAYTGGGAYFSRGANEVTAAGVTQRDDEWQGLDTLTPDERLVTGRSPMAVNWDGARKIGSRCVRSGAAKLDDDRDTLTAEFATLTVVAVGDFTADTDYVTFTKPNTDTHAFWFDVTGSDVEPAGSQAADDSTRVVVFGTTAPQAAIALANAINQSNIGLNAVSRTGSATISVYQPDTAETWSLTETVTDTGFTITDFTASALESDVSGVSLAFMPGSGDNTPRMVMVFANGRIGQRVGPVTGSGVIAPYTLHLTDTTLRWGNQRSLKGVPGPSVTLSQQATTVLRVTSVYTNAFPTAQNELMRASVKQIIVRYSTIGYPLDPDGLDERESVLLADRATWDGASRNDDTADLVVGKYYVTVWGVSIEGVSEPSFTSITLT